MDIATLPLEDVIRICRRLRGREEAPFNFAAAPFSAEDIALLDAVQARLTAEGVDWQDQPPLAA